MDFGILLEPLEGDNPSGVELRNEPRFHAIERLLETATKTNRVLPDGTLNPSAAPIDWPSIERDGLDLAQTGRDLIYIEPTLPMQHLQDPNTNLGGRSPEDSKILLRINQ